MSYRIRILYIYRLTIHLHSQVPLQKSPIESLVNVHCEFRCGFSRSPFVMNFMGCLSGADADVLDAHEEGLMKMFCDEYMRYLGPFDVCFLDEILQASRVLVEST